MSSLASRPNDTRVRGAGPARKTFMRPKVCKAPHPLQPIVRRLLGRSSAGGATLLGGDHSAGDDTQSRALCARTAVRRLDQPTPDSGGCLLIPAADRLTHPDRLRILVTLRGADQMAYRIHRWKVHQHGPEVCSP
jgi:hypothetical protein